VTEGAFLQKNAEKGERFETLLRRRRDGAEEADPDRLAELFVEVTDDLSYARTFFPEGPHGCVTRQRRPSRESLM
jgi:hypothetical protein